MAISPNLLNENFMEEVSSIEKEIDQKLSVQSVRPGGSVNVDTPHRMNSTHFSILVPRYIKVGWKDVIWNSDQREGEWLTFKA